jgi:hypothetical protein
MRSQKALRRRSVFVNVPFDKSYEPLFVALITGLVAIGRSPRCVVEVPDQGDGRLVRILKLIQSCSISIHDLSRVRLPVRFNMPFELGIAFTLRRIERNHQFILLEAKRYRLQRTLSDVNGIDPGIHGGTVKGMISCVLSSLGKPSANPDPSQVERIYHHLWNAVPVLKANHSRTTIYSRSIFQQLVMGAARLAKKEGLIPA